MTVSVKLVGQLAATAARKSLKEFLRVAVALLSTAVPSSVRTCNPLVGSSAVAVQVLFSPSDRNLAQPHCLAYD